MTSYPTVELRVVVRNAEKVREVLNAGSSPELYNIAFSRMIPAMLKVYAEETRSVVHRITGHLAESIDWKYDVRHTRGSVFLSPRIVYARGSTLQWPWIYGAYEHQRGGDHAFFERAIRLEGWIWSHYGLDIGVTYLRRRFG